MSAMEKNCGFGQGPTIPGFPETSRVDTCPGKDSVLSKAVGPVKALLINALEKKTK
jgi:hypothetical protein